MDASTPPIYPGLDILSSDYASNCERFIARAHREFPVHFYPPLNIWVVSKYKCVRAALFDQATYSSSAWGLIPPPAPLASRVEDMNTDVRINSMDPPDHAKLRVPVQKAFLPAGLTAVEASARRIANELIDEFISAGQCDLLHDFCYKFSLQVVVDLLGLPKERAEDYHRWATSFFSLFTPKSPEGTKAENLRLIPEDVLRGRWTDLAEANEFLRDVVERIDAAPGSNLLSRLLQLREQDGSRTLSVSANVRNALDFVAAGHDTSATAIAHLVYFTCNTPGLKASLGADSSLIPAAVDETVRRRGSADGVFRRTTRDVEIDGVQVPAGSIVYLHLTAANLDPAEFAEPEAFVLNRPNVRNLLSFGYGRHVCVGQFLAKLEARVAYEELSRRIPTLRLPPEFRLSYTPAVMNVVINELPVLWDVPTT